MCRDAQCSGTGSQSCPLHQYYSQTGTPQLLKMTQAYANTAAVDKIIKPMSAS